MAILEAEAVSKTYRNGDIEVKALRPVDLMVERGEFVSIMGPSGSGKSTLLNLIGCLDRPTSGQYRLDGRAVEAMNDAELAAIRNQMLGFVFQTYNLLERMTALENVALPLVYRGIARGERTQRARQALEAVGLGDRIHHRPNQLSGGQQQRVAIARALVGEPRVILADEPTGNLDTSTGDTIMELFQRLHRQQGMTLIQVTHDPRLAQFGERMIRLQDGRIEGDERLDQPVGDQG